MIIQRCPRCNSNRIRRGYRRTPWWWAMFGRYNLLCNQCNWEFIGFAVPGTVTENVRKRKKSKDDKLDAQPLASATKKPLVGEETAESIQEEEFAVSSNQMVAKDTGKLEEKTNFESRNLLTDLSEISQADFFNKIDSNQDDTLNRSTTNFLSHQTENKEIELLGNTAATLQQTKVKKRVRRKKKL